MSGPPPQPATTVKVGQIQPLKVAKHQLWLGWIMRQGVCMEQGDVHPTGACMGDPRAARMARLPCF